MFSLTQQSIQLGFLPRMHIEHTTSHAIGQIYVPLVNWLLAAGTLGAVLIFGSSDALAGAYGIAVSLLMAITTLLAALVAIQWGFSPFLVIAVNGFFLAIDIIFFAANSIKLFEGGWFPLVLAALRRVSDADLAQRRQTGRTGPRQPAPAGRRFDRDRRQQMPREARRGPRSSWPRPPTACRSR